MRKGIKIFIGVAVVIVLLVGALLAAPLFYDKRVSEELPGVSDSLSDVAPGVPLVTGSAMPSDQPVATDSSVTEIVRGVFEGADSFHKAAGVARIVASDGKKYVRFEDDFEVTNGPDLYVYLGKNGEYDGDTNLGRLKGNVGSQNYEIPNDINLDDYDEVWVWCRAFFVPFGHAVLQ